MVLNTLEYASGRSQAAVKAPTAPLLAPPMALSFPDFDKMITLPSVVLSFNFW
jgi:hypothetical protein